MSELSKLKDWFFLDDAAKQLSKHLDEELNDRDVLQAVLEGHLSLSWNVMVKKGLPADAGLNKPNQPIVDTSLIKHLRGQFRLVLESNEINLAAGYNIREEWLMRLLKRESVNEGMFNSFGFLIEDINGKLWRPLKYVGDGDGVSGLFGLNDPVVTPIPQGYYPQIDMPNISELVIRKSDLLVCLQKIASSDEDKTHQVSVETELSFRDVLINPPEKHSDEYEMVKAAVIDHIKKEGSRPDADDVIELLELTAKKEKAALRKCWGRYTRK